MAKKKKFEKITNITYVNPQGEVVNHKMTGNTGGYSARDLNNETPALLGASQTTNPINTIKDVRTITLDEANKNLRNADNDLKVASNRYQNALSRELKKTGEDYKTTFDDTRNEKISYQTKDEDKLPTKPKVIPIQEANKNLQNELQEKDKAYESWKIANYENNLAKVNNEKTTLLDKTIGTPIRAIKDLFSPLTVGEDEIIRDENGNKTFLPSYNELKQQKVRQDTGGLAGVAQDVGYNATKVLGATALDALSGGIGGKALYWTDMAIDNFKNVKNQGYSNEQALANTIISTGSEFLTEKLLGGLTKEINPGKISQLDEALTKSVGKFIANPKVASVIGSMGSEGVEEFTQEWIGALNNKITLGEDTNIDKLVQDSLYSALVGAGSGGVVRATSPNMLRIDQVVSQTPQTNATQTTTQQNLAENTTTQPTSTNNQTNQNVSQTEEKTPINEPKKNQQLQFNLDNTENTQSSAENINEKIKEPTLQIKSQEFKEAQQKVSDGTATEKERQFIKSAVEAQNTEEMVKEMDDFVKTYETTSNEKNLNRGKAKLSSFKTLEEKANYVSNLLTSGKRIDSSDVAAAELVLKDAAASKNAKVYNDVLSNIAIYATEAGQNIQALSLIKKLSPSSQLDTLEKIVKREQAKGNKIYKDVEITEDMKNRIFECYDSEGNIDQEKFDTTMEEIKQELADKMGTTVAEKVRAWRYLSMLGNPKTHIRNMVANVAMSVVKKSKDTVSAGMQDVASATGLMDKSQKTNTLKFASKDVKKLSKQLANDIYVNDNTSKYNEQSDLENRRQIFKLKNVEKASKINENLLSKEDKVFKKMNFEWAFSNYLTAQGISTQEDINNNSKVIQQAKNFAMEEANIATFNQRNKLAEWINSADNKLGGVGRVVRGAIIPFTRTPLNIAKTGIEYTPGTGLLKTAFDVKNAPDGQKGRVFIDGISKQITGSSLALLGYALAKSGMVTADAGDDKDDKFEKDLGNKMGYSIKFPGSDKSYDLSWLSPSSMPFFVGAQMFEILDKQEGISENVILEAIATTLDPLSEMSVVSSFNKILQSYSKKGAQQIGDSAKQTMQSYLSQFIPTTLGQIARIFDDTKRSTYADSNSKNKTTQETYRQLAYKIPGLRNTLPAQTDYYGREKKETKNRGLRALDAFVNPANYRKSTMSKEDKELVRLYRKTGNDKIVPYALKYNIKYDDENYQMSQKEYNKYKKTFGDSFKDNLKELMASSEYENATDNEKAKMIEGIMDYSKDKTKDIFLEGKGKDYSDERDKVDDFVGNKMGISDYYALKVSSSVKLGDSYRSIVSGDNALKNIALVDAFDMDPKDYLTYSYELGQIRADKRSNGTTINGSAKRKKIDYIQSLPLSASQKQMLYSLKVDGSSKKKTNSNVIQAIENADLSAEEKQELYDYIYR